MRNRLQFLDRWVYLLFAALIIPACHDGGGGSTGPTTSGPATISDDGSRVAFESNSRSLTSGNSLGRNQVFLFDRTAGTTRLVTVGQGTEPDADSGDPAISAD